MCLKRKQRPERISAQMRARNSVATPPIQACKPLPRTCNTLTIASNVALGRNTAGVHWRSDATESHKLGEAIAIGILTEQRACYNEVFNGFSLTKFDGTTITV